MESRGPGKKKIRECRGQGQMVVSSRGHGKMCHGEQRSRKGKFI